MGLGASSSKSSTATNRGGPTTSSATVTIMGGQPDTSSPQQPQPPPATAQSKNNNNPQLAHITQTDFPGQVTESERIPAAEEKRTRWRDQSFHRKEEHVYDRPTSLKKPSWMTDELSRFAPSTSSSRHPSDGATNARDTVSARTNGGLTYDVSAVLQATPSTSTGRNSTGRTDSGKRDRIDQSSVFVMDAAAAAATGHDAELKKLLSWDRVANQTMQGAKTRNAAGTGFTDFETHWSDDGDILAIVVPSTWKSGRRRRDSASSLDEDIREIERTVSVDSGLEGAPASRSGGQYRRDVTSSPSARDRLAAGPPLRKCTTTPIATRPDDGTPSVDLVNTANQVKGLSDSTPETKNRQSSGLASGSSASNDVGPEGTAKASAAGKPPTTTTTKGRQPGMASGSGSDAARPTTRPTLRRGPTLSGQLKSSAKHTERGTSLSESSIATHIAETERISDWSYRQPKIDGFDPVKFKEANSRNNNLGSTARHITLPM